MFHFFVCLFVHLSGSNGMLSEPMFIGQKIIYYILNVCFHDSSSLASSFDFAHIQYVF